MRKCSLASLCLRLPHTSSLQEYEAEDTGKDETGLSCSFQVLSSIGTNSENSTEVGFCISLLSSHLFADLPSTSQVVFSPGVWPFSSADDVPRTASRASTPVLISLNVRVLCDRKCTYLIERDFHKFPILSSDSGIFKHKNDWSVNNTSCPNARW